MEMISKIKSVGGSLMVTIPKETARQESLQKDELVKIRVKKMRKSGFGILKGIGSFSKKDELNTHD